MTRALFRPLIQAIRSVMGTNGLYERVAALDATARALAATTGDTYSLSTRITALEASLQYASNTRIEQEVPLPATKHVETVETSDKLKGFRVGTLADLDEMNASFEKSPLRERIHGVGHFLLKVGELPLQQAGDPFSDEYKEKVVETWGLISGRDSYDSRRDELASYLDPQAAVLKPAFYVSGDSRYVGEALSGIGFILQQLDVRGGDSVLEYGAGEGQIALTLARTGCQVAVIDVEPKYLDGITLQARAIGAQIAVQQGVFGDAFADGQTFDRILFFEAFHHALEHKKVLRQLHAHLKPEGYVVFSGEPILASDNSWAPVVPYPWGPRLDGLSVNAMRVHGWCELGFCDDYFVELLTRTGYVCEYHPCPATALGSCHIARPHGGELRMGEPFLISVSGREAGWHLPEEGLRWTMAHAILPLDDVAARTGIEVVFSNFLPLARNIKIRLGSAVQSLRFGAGEERVVRFDVPVDAVWLEILADPVSRASHAGVHDTHMVGIAVRMIRYPGVITP